MSSGVYKNAYETRWAYA